MNNSRRAWLAVLLLIVLCLSAACDRLTPAPAADSPGVDLSDPDVGGGAGQETGPQTPIPTPSATSELSPRLDATAAAGLPTATTVVSPTPSPTADRRPPTAAPSPTADAPTATATLEPPTATPEASPVPPTATPGGETESSSETIHVVQAGENLYRIGLQYGLSWVIIAQYNGITDPNAITVGQEIRIPPTTPTPEATTQAAGDGQQTSGLSSADDGQQTTDDGQQTTDDSQQPAVVSGLSSVVRGPSSIITVAPGDTLYAIAQRHGVSWDQVAEANGLTAPNQIYVGQPLKIPADAPGPTPDFTHQVHRGETLTGIAQQYGLSPDALAAANALAAPYVIYPGQGLVIPGG